MKTRHFIFALAWLAFGTMAGSAQVLGHRLRVVTSFLPLYCFTANIAGDLATVDNLLPPGAEPHDFQFSPREMKQLEAADLVVVNGLGLEAWLTRVMDAQSHSANIVIASQGFDAELIPSLPSLNSENSTTAKPGGSMPANPHVWLDPQLAEQAVANILLAMQRVDPANASGYATNAAAYIVRMEKLDADLRAGLAPFKGQAIITAHDAFPYFAQHYGLKIAGVIERVPEVEPSPKYLTGLKEAIDTYHVKAIFAEPQSSAKLAAQIGIDYHVAVGQLDTLETGELKPDTYEQGMRANLAALQKYLQ